MPAVPARERPCSPAEHRSRVGTATGRHAWLLARPEPGAGPPPPVPTAVVEALPLLPLRRGELGAQRKLRLQVGVKHGCLPAS